MKISQYCEKPMKSCISENTMKISQYCEKPMKSCISENTMKISQYCEKYMILIERFISWYSNNTMTWYSDNTMKVNKNPFHGILTIP